MYNFVYIFLNGMSGKSQKKVDFKKEYKIDDILSEISEKGVDNVDKDKIEFLKTFKK